MKMTEFIETFEFEYDVEINKSGVRKLHKLYSRFEEEIICEALGAAMEQYEDAEDAFDKIGGICYNMSRKPYFNVSMPTV